MLTSQYHNGGCSFNCPSANKQIIIRYSEGLKGYVMYGEQPSGGMTKIESHDVAFIENNFPSIGEAKKDLELYKLQELDKVTPSFGNGGESQSHLETTKDNKSGLPPNRSVSVSGSVQLESNSQDFQLRRSEREILP